MRRKVSNIMRFMLLEFIYGVGPLSFLAPAKQMAIEQMIYRGYRVLTLRPCPNVQIVQMEHSVFCVIDGESRLFFSQKRRGREYFNGIEARLAKVLAKYCPVTHFSDRLIGAHVVDCGANVGEFSMAALRHGARRVLLFEPDPACAFPLYKNFSEETRATVHNVVLGEESKVADFFLSSEGADSSTIEPSKYCSKVALPMRRLADFGEDLQGPVFIKLEAEGAEPEVLSGAHELLRRDNVCLSIDVGPERHGQKTDELCAGILERYDFKVQVHGNVLIAWKNR